MIEVPAILVIAFLIFIPIAGVSIIGNSWVASKAVEMMEARYAQCKACSICIQREKAAKESQAHP